MPPTSSERAATVLHADLENYTGRMARDPHGTVASLKSCRSVFHSCVTAAGGRVVNQAADSILAEFGDPRQGVLCALSIQSRLAEPPAARGDLEPLRYRVGLDHGELIALDDELYGLAVNCAARIQEIAEPGEVLVSEAVQSRVAGRDIEFNAEGVLRLKNLPGPVAVYRARRADAPADVAGRRRALKHMVLPALPSIVVLPFRGLGTDSLAELLAEGLTDEVIANLSRFRELFVIGRASSFAYRHQAHAPALVADELGVHYALDGSLVLGDDRVRLTAHLVETATGKVAWSERYDRTLEDMLEVESDLARRLAATLAGRVEEHEQQRLQHGSGRRLEAYGHLLGGLRELYRYTQANNELARAAFARAVEIDPAYARAFAMLSRTHSYDWRYRWSADPAASLEEASALAQRAVALDPVDARGHAELGWVKLYSKDVPGALEAYRTAHRLNPNDPDILALLADALVYAGQPAEALALVARAKRLNPHYPDIYLWSEADALFSLGRYEEVIAVIGRMRDPSEGCRLLAASHALAGRLEEAKRYAALVLRRQPGFSVADWIATQPDTDPDARERFRAGLLLAGLPP